MKEYVVHQGQVLTMRLAWLHCRLLTLGKVSLDDRRRDLLSCDVRTLARKMHVIMSVCQSKSPRKAWDSIASACVCVCVCVSVSLHKICRNLGIPLGLLV